MNHKNEVEKMKKQPGKVTKNFSGFQPKFEDKDKSKNKTYSA